jgi:anti-anti-sigma factor
VSVKLPVCRTELYTVAELPAEVDVSNADGVQAAVLELLDRAGRREGVAVLLDLRRMTFCDSSIVGITLYARTRARALGCFLGVIVPPTGAARRVFDLAAIDHLVPLYEDIPSAIGDLIADRRPRRTTVPSEE